MRLIDTHLHLIARDRFGYGWTKGIGPLEDGNFTLGDYQALTGDTVAGAVFMEVAVDEPHVQEEARHFAALARTDDGLLGVIASCRPETDEGFEVWLEECAGLGVNGFRRVLHVVPDDVSRSATFRANVRRVGERGFAFDMCFLARQLPLALELAKACPDTQMVLDHCGVSDIAGGGLDLWRADMKALAERSNVVCKLSGITAYCAEDDRSLSAIRPYVDHIIETFGPDRILWGSDWPVVNLGSGLPDWIAMTQQILQALSRDEAAAIAQNTARRIYRLDMER